MSDAVERRLAAILSADAVGYSRLMAEDEEATVRTLTDYRERVETLVREHRGRVVDSPGDNILAEFPSAVFAVRCSLAVQRLLRERNIDLAPGRRLEYRIGVHLGDIRVEGNRIYGDGVNVAARLEGLAEPGGVCISGLVRSQVRSHVSLELEDLGEQRLRNIPEPVAAYRIRPGPDAGAPPQRDEGVRPGGDSRIGSVAVLPLENLSGDPEEDYFVDGMTETLIGDLAQLESIRVISRTSVMQYKHVRKPLPEIARELNVDAIVEGTVLRVGERVRITAQLIRAATDEHLWAERYDRDLSDVLALHSEVAEAVARAVEARLTNRERRRLARVESVDPAAHDAYLRARFEAARFSEEGLRKAIAHFEEAIRRDPRYARAYAGLAQSWFTLGQPLGALSHDETMPRARAAALKALELDDALDEAHRALAEVRFTYERDFDGAEREFLRAIELAAGRPPHSYAVFLAAIGRHDEAIAAGVQATECDPFSLSVRTGWAEAFYCARQYERAIEECRRTLEMDPDFERAHVVARWAYEQTRQYGRAIEAYARSERLGTVERESLERAHETSGPAGYWRFQLARLKALATERNVGFGKIAKVHVALGEEGAALDWLERAYEKGDSQLAFLKGHPHWDPLRGEPRFDALLAKLGLG